MRVPCTRCPHLSVLAATDSPPNPTPKISRPLFASKKPTAGVVVSPAFSTRDISTSPLPLLLVSTASACGQRPRCQVTRILGGPHHNHLESVCHLMGSSPAPALPTWITGHLAAQYVCSTSTGSI
jgi:hypothetical protein